MTSKEEQVFAEVLGRVVGVIAGALDDNQIMSLDRFSESLRDTARICTHSTSSAILEGIANGLTGQDKREP